MGRPKPIVPTTHTVQLSGSVLMDAAAKYFARYSMFVAWSGSIHLFRTFFSFALHIQPGAESLIPRVRDKPFLSRTFPRIDSHDLHQPVQGHHNICQDSPI